MLRPQSMKITPAYDHPQETARLFSEYTNLLIAGDSSFREYPDIQHYDEEILHPESKYGLPGGRLYLAYCNKKLAGCIGLKKIDGKNCDMKRLYVREQFRGQQIGNQLILKIITDAKEIGYSHMLLDTRHPAIFLLHTATTVILWPFSPAPSAKAFTIADVFPSGRGFRLILKYS